jgi:hypothetical protein
VPRAHMFRGMGKKRATATIALGGLLALAGFATSVVYFLQPWRTCDYDDSPAACAMLPADAGVMTVAMFVTVFGLAVGVVGIYLWRRTISAIQTGAKGDVQFGGVG